MRISKMHGEHLNDIASMWMNTMTTILMARATLMRFMTEMLAIRCFYTATGRISAFARIPAKVQMKSSLFRCFLYAEYTHCTVEKKRMQKKKSKST